MKKITLIPVIVLLMVISASAQPPVGGKPGQQAPAIGHIYGKITDTTGASLNDVTVLLLQSRFDTVTKKRKEVLLKGISTKNNVEFSFSELPVF